MRSKVRAYSHQGHGPRADQQAGYISATSDSTTSLAKGSRSIHLGHNRPNGSPDRKGCYGSESSRSGASASVISARCGGTRLKPHHTAKTLAGSAKRSTSAAALCRVAKSRSVLGLEWLLWCRHRPPYYPRRRQLRQRALARFQPWGVGERVLVDQLPQRGDDSVALFGCELRGRHGRHSPGVAERAA
jgi:hypothetical protein